MSKSKSQITDYELFNLVKSAIKLGLVNDYLCREEYLNLERFDNLLEQELNKTIEKAKSGSYAESSFTYQLLEKLLNKEAKEAKETKEVEETRESVVIDMAKDFSEVPFTTKDSHPSVFLDKFLLPNLSSGKHVTIDVSNVLSMSSSFIEQSFGKLFEHGYSEEFLKEHLEVVSSDSLNKLYVGLVWFHIAKAG